MKVYEIKRAAQELMKAFNTCCLEFDLAEDGVVYMTIEGIGKFTFWNDGQYNFTAKEKA